MNQLAHVVHELMTGATELQADPLQGLFPQERAALLELCVLFEKSPSQVAELLAQGPVATDWYSPPGVTKS